MCMAKAPALSALVTLEKEEREKERNSGRLLSWCHQICSNCTSECKRGPEGVGVRGRGLLSQWQHAQWWHSSFSVGTHTHSLHQGIPPRTTQVIQPITALSHQCPKTGERSVEKCFHEPPTQEVYCKGFWGGTVNTGQSHSCFGCISLC